MAELIGDIFRGDSWNFPGGKDTQILHTNSEDMSSDSPTQGKVEEQSSFKTPGSKGQMRQFAAARLACTDSARLATERDSPAAAEAANGPLTEAANCQMPVTFSSSSNSSACCMPVLSAQVAPSYDINASAQAAEQLLQHHSPSQAHVSQHSGQGHINHLPANLQPQAVLPPSAVQSILASVFDDVDSGRHQQAESESAQPSQNQFSHHRRGVMQQDSLPSAYRSFFPEEAPSLQAQQQQQQLRHYQLSQLLPPQLQDRQHQQHMHQLPGHQPQQLSFPGRANAQQPVSGLSTQQMPSDMQQWPSPVSHRASPSSAVQAHHTSGHAAASHQQIKLEDLEGLDLSGLKRDYSSFTGPASQPRQPKPAPRRALSFTQGSIGSAATTAAVGTTAGRRALGGASSSQAVSNSRMSTPASNVTSPPDTDVSLSDSDDLSGSDSGGLNIKRRRVVKGVNRRPRRMVCKNCGAHQTPQWRCGPEGPRTLCNACGVRYKKGLPLNGAVKVADNSN
ncbi:TPA: hypothetical protein ACH3X2_010390 [Trebouxia sp. C0005]